MRPDRGFERKLKLFDPALELRWHGPSGCWHLYRRSEGREGYITTVYPNEQNDELFAKLRMGNMYNDVAFAQVREQMRQRAKRAKQDGYGPIKALYEDVVRSHVGRFGRIFQRGKTVTHGEASRDFRHALKHDATLQRDLAKVESAGT